MPFKSILEEIVRQSDGGFGCVVMGYDGIAIDEYRAKAPALDVHLLAVEYASVLKEIKRTVGVLQTGELEEVSIISGQCRVIVRAVTEEFFVVLVMSADGNYGKGRYLLKRDAGKLKEALQ